MKWFSPLLALALSVGAWADEPTKPNQLTPKEIADGWISLFDGETTFGWKIDGEAKVENGTLVVGGNKESRATLTTPFALFALVWESSKVGEAGLRLGGAFPGLSCELSKDWRVEKTVVRMLADGKLVAERYEKSGTDWDLQIGVGGDNQIALHMITVEVPNGSKAMLRNVKLRPLGYKPIFNGKDLTGWKEFPGKKSKWSVSKEGWIHLEDGPGDLQTEDQWADFILSAECISNGPHCNSGIFFRCIPGQYQQGYEAQIRNEWKDDDRTKPIDFGTGAIYRRQAARKVVSSDHEWFTMTIAAHGNHLATWVNGYQVTDFTDTRPPNDNARNGSKTGKGAISLQGHDPTTNLDFRNIRIVELPPATK
jgi:hypothetical protein